MTEDGGEHLFVSIAARCLASGTEYDDLGVLLKDSDISSTLFHYCCTCLCLYSFGRSFIAFDLVSANLISRST